MAPWKYIPRVIKYAPLCLLASCAAHDRFSDQKEILGDKTPTPACTFYTKLPLQNVEQGCQGNTSWGYFSGPNQDVTWATDSGAHNDAVAISIQDPHGLKNTFVVTDPLSDSPRIAYQQTPANIRADDLAILFRKALRQCTQNVQTVKTLVMPIGSEYSSGPDVIVGVGPFESTPRDLQNLANMYRGAGRMDHSGYNSNGPGTFRFSLREALSQ